MVADVIGFSGSNHGTTAVGPAICGGGCPPADWQQFAGSNFIQALNSGAETFPGVSYTEIYTHTDEVVQPNAGPNASAAVHGDETTDIATQMLCPTDIDEHLMIGTIDPVAYALALDALTHPGPADPARIPASVCSQAFMPGVDPGNANSYLQILAGAPGLLSVAAAPAATATTGAPLLKAEPPLGCYVFAACSGSQAPTLNLWTTLSRRRLKRGRRTRIHVLVRVDEGGVLVPVPGVALAFAGRHELTDGDGDATFLVRLSHPGPYRLSASRRGCNSASTVLRAGR
jgi:hypothetical protein